jgi:hypothetical protein
MINQRSRRDEVKALKREKKEYNQCITCRRACSMSGLCMRQWPEFVNRKKKGVENGGKDN